MARFYTNEKIPLHVVTELRRLGHDVQTSLDAGTANAAVRPSAYARIFVALPWSAMSAEPKDRTNTMSFCDTD